MATQNIFDLADLWNDGGTTFTSIKMNTTDTASDAASLLIDLQISASSKFSVSKAGVLTIAGSFTGAGTGLTGTGASFTAGSVTTNANLTGEVTSVGNAAVLGSFDASALNTALSDVTFSGNNTGDADVVADTTPQLGGFLDSNNKFISNDQGANIASVAGDTDIWANFDGNTVHITGTNAITDFGTPKVAGDSMWVIFDGAASVVDSATITCVGNVNFQAAANDMALVYALSASTFLFIPFPNVPYATSAEYRANTALVKLLESNQVWDSMAEVQLTSSSNSVAWDMSLGIDFEIDLTENTTIANPSNTTVGKKGRFRIEQDAGGTNTVAWGTSFEFASGSAPTATVTGDAEDIFYYDVITSTRILVSAILDIS